MSRLRDTYPADEVLPIESGLPDDDTRLGDLMRGERATLGKSLLDVQRELRIRASYVAAIENCDISAFDTPSFISGYVRSYARYLGMDPDWTFRRFCTESGFQPTHGMAPAAAGPKPTRRPSDPAEALANPRALFIPQEQSFWSDVEPRAIGSVLVLVAVVCGLAYGGYTVLQEVQRVTLAPGEGTPAIVTTLDPVAQPSLVGPEVQFDTDIAALPQPEAVDRMYRPQILEAPVLTARDGPIAAIDPGLVFDVPDVGSVIASADVAATPRGTDFGPDWPGQQVAVVDAPVRTVAPDAPELELLAARPAWVRVTSADGTVLLEKIMDAGERFTLPKLEDAPRLRTGNSGAVYFAVNGQTYGPAAPGAQVISNVELSPSSLTDRFALADMAKDPELAQMVAIAQVDAALTGPLTSSD
ncbi:helix-turn-helix domain-containing protein [Paracoccus sp. (in: a-proteobacteria)]|uniref:helix-turn-helix domain-containing protein n=1 Tax=Paracoccus sp. TaxID=267 RepID=UPI0026DEFF06|nr:helix-turn-helix domain-containing protein [Paracoccus sp. (in: a-proteobacteria)]MDO5646808.1 DUF4115 domain-containing protein [Paracoccus sp. (in: a-proteobacteria)]